MTPTWSQLNETAFEVAQQIIRKGKEYDRIVTLAKGGWPMSRSLVDFLNISSVASVGIKFYQGINNRMNRPEVYQDLPVKVKGERVLLFDDVADTGESLDFTTEYLRSQGVAEVDCATLFYKPHSQFKPAFYAAETEAWIIFPYEIFESMNLLMSKWQDKMTLDEILVRFSQLGVEERYIKHFKKLYNL